MASKAGLIERLMSAIVSSITVASYPSPPMAAGGPSGWGQLTLTNWCRKLLPKQRHHCGFYREIELCRWRYLVLLKAGSEGRLRD